MAGDMELLSGLDILPDGDMHFSACSIAMKLLCLCENGGVIIVSLALAADADGNVFQSYIVRLGDLDQFPISNRATHPSPAIALVVVQFLCLVFWRSHTP